MSCNVFLVVLSILNQVQLRKEVLLETVKVNPLPMEKVIFSEICFDVVLAEWYSHFDYFGIEECLFANKSNSGEIKISVRFLS